MSACLDGIGLWEWFGTARRPVCVVCGYGSLGTVGRVGGQAGRTWEDGLGGVNGLGRRASAQGPDAAMRSRVRRGGAGHKCGGKCREPGLVFRAAVWV